MKKLLFFFIVLCINVQLYAQLDLEHWFPPIFSSGGRLSSFEINLSTDKTTPFKVYIYNDNTLIGVETIDVNHPVKFEIPDSAQLLATTVRRTMIASSMGLHLVGEKSFYANLMMGSSINAAMNSEVISSKGKTALGNNFLIVTDKNIQYGNKLDGFNSQTSIMAKNDNTHIKIINYDRRLVFANGFSGPELNITLNRDQSYIVTFLKNENNIKTSATLNGILDDDDPNFIGAQISADQPVIVSNGNFLSQDLGIDGGSLNIDQSIPIDKIGKEYLIVNGFSNTNNVMEKAILVATENNTSIYLNGATTPLTVLNKGQYYIGPYPQYSNWQPSNEPNYVNTDLKTIETKGMLIQGSKPFYCYQLIGAYHDIPRGGAYSMLPYTSAMSISLPLDTPINSNIVTLSSLNKIGYHNFVSKIIIKSENNANILINGLPPTTGTPIPGKTNWKYIAITGNTGEYTITSDKALNIDFFGSKQYTGYAGSITSHSTDPYIIVNGNCIQEETTLKLSNEDFDSFQWQLNGADIPGANSSTLTPTTPGNYRCKLGYYGGLFYYTNEVTVSDCPYIVTDKDYGAICSNSTINPIFSTPNDQYTVDVIKILTQGTKGVAKVENGKITYTPNPQSTGSDRFIYQICNNATGFCETTKASLTINPSPSGDNVVDSIMPFSFDDDSNTFDLTSAINPSKPGETYSFFEDINLSIPIITPTQYKTSSKIAYVQITNALGCTISKSINLLDPKPQIVNLPNAFSPNDDGINDTWDFSILKNTISPTVIIFDRYGTKIFEFKNDDKFYWTGKDATGRPLPTSSYWAVVQWTDKKTNLPMEKKMWILLKNR